MGRRRGLKILCPQGRVGSNPTRPTHAGHWFQSALHVCVKSVSLPFVPFVLFVFDFRDLSF